MSNSFPKGPRDEKAADKRRRFVAWLIETRTPADPAAGSYDLELHAARAERDGLKDVSGKLTRQVLIDARCYQCESVADDSNGIQRIRNCGVRACTLRPHRPYRKDRPESAAGAPAGMAKRSRNDAFAVALAKPMSRAAAVKGYCYECMGGERQPSMLRTVAQCTAVTCALWAIRPRAEFGPADEAPGQPAATTAAGQTT